MTYSIVKASNFRDAQFLSIENNLEREPRIITDPIHIKSFHHSCNGDDNVTFAITRDMCTNLYTAVTELESSILITLRNMNVDYFTNLPFVCRKVLTEYNDLIESQFYKVLRPNYYLKDIPMMYLKGDFKTIKIFSEPGNEELHKSQLGPGEYQFIINASTVYMGLHKHPLHVSSLQLRILEIRFKPATAVETSPVNQQPISEVPTKQQRKRNTSGSVKSTKRRKQVKSQTPEVLVDSINLNDIQNLFGDIDD